MKEKDIVYENGAAWVFKDRDKYTVFHIGITHSTSDSAYALDDDGLALAKARVDYLGISPQLSRFRLLADAKK